MTAQQFVWSSKESLIGGYLCLLKGGWGIVHWGFCSVKHRCFGWLRGQVCQDELCLVQRTKTAQSCTEVRMERGVGGFWCGYVGVSACFNLGKSL